MSVAGECRDQIVIRIDGGLCSQILFVALGLHLKNRGLTVKYDLSWFKACAKDMEGKADRNWDIPKAFPLLEVEAAGERESSWLREHLWCRGEVVDSYEPPLYVGTYPQAREELLIRYADVFRKAFSPVYNTEDALLKAEIEACPACAVHVRRGDLARGDKYYGGATSVEYFLKAMTVVKGLNNDVRFFFFSDDPEWVEKNIIPAVVDKSACKVVKSNGSDRGYMDLFMMTHCPYVISSIGSLGVFAAILSKNNKCLVMSHRRDWVFTGVENVYYLNDDQHAPPTNYGDVGILNIPENKLHGVWWLLFKLWRVVGCLWGQN